MTVLYSPQTLDQFTENMMGGNGLLVEKDFEEDLESIGSDFDLENLVKTVHDTFISKLVVEHLMYRKSLRDLCITGDETVDTLKNQDNFYTAVHASSSNLMFNIALSELFYLTQDFPKDVSEECRKECKKTIKDAVKYLRGDVRYNPDKNQFENRNGRRFKRVKSAPFRAQYNRERNHVKGDPTHTERGLIALYRAFAHENKRFKDDLGLLRACIYADDQPTTDMDTALGRIIGIKENLSVIKPNRLSMRYHVTRDILNAFNQMEPGYEILEDLVTLKDRDGERISPQVPEWAKKMELNLGTKLKFGYIDIKFGKYGKAISNIAFYNSLIAVAGLGLLQFVGSQFPGVNEAVANTPIAGALYEVFGHPLYKVGAVGLLLGAFDQLPAKILSGQYKKILPITYS